MLLGDIRIVNGKVRLYDVDGSYAKEYDLTPFDAFKFEEWIIRNRYRLLEEQRLQVMVVEKKKEKPE